MNRSWGPLGVILLFLVVALLVTVMQAEEPPRPPLLATSNQEDGARALQLWLRGLGYRVSTQRVSRYTPPAEASVVLLLAPTDWLEADEVTQLAEWIDAGNLLLVAAEYPLSVAALLEHLDVTLEPSFAFETPLAAVSPLLAGPLGWETATVTVDNTIATDRTDVVPLLRIEDGPVAVLIPHGDGHVVLTTLTEPFTNRGLQEADNPALALNLIALTGAAQRGTIWFDDWHHGVRGSVQTLSGPGQWLRQTAPGRATLFAMAVLLAVLVWRGRRFGRPRPLPGAQQRRAPLEYVTAIANLNRRAHNRVAVLGDYRLRLKRQIGRRYHISAQLPDDDFVAEVRRANGTLDANALADLLARLNRPQVSEAQLVTLAAAVDKLLNGGKKEERLGD